MYPWLFLHLWTELNWRCEDMNRIKIEQTLSKHIHIQGCSAVWNERAQSVASANRPKQAVL